MAVSIDTSKPFLRPSDLTALARSILSAGEADEADWIEWKSDIDLKSPEGRGHSARHILGFSNRDPDRASRFAGGWGYLVIGVEPGQLVGTPEVDPADLDQALRGYLGEDGPQWIPTNLKIDGATVLLIAVEPPRWGDSIKTLRKQFDKYRSGDVFVRRNGATHKANAAELEMLQQRLIRATPAGSLDIALSIDGKRLTPIEYRTEDIEHWLEEERARRLVSLEKRRPTPALGVSPILMERRSHDDYAAEVGHYIMQCQERLPAQVTEIAVGRGLGLVQPKVGNLTEENFPSVRVVLELSDDVAVAEHDFAAPDLPKAPLPFGSPSFASLVVPDVSGIPTFHHSGIELEKDGAVHRATFDPVDLRPDGQARLPEIHLFPHLGRAGSTLDVSWTATSTGVPGVVRGAIELEVGDQPVTTKELLRHLRPM